MYGNNSDVHLDLSHINEDSFQRYAKFFGNTIPTDDEFINKLNSIYIAVIKDHDTKISSIAKKSNCSSEECVLKIRYLKNKRMLGDFYIDTLHDELVMCSEEDSKLLKDTPTKRIFSLLYTLDKSSLHTLYISLVVSVAKHSVLEVE